MPNYTRAGKQEVPMEFSQFIENMKTGKFCKPSHRAFAVVLVYYGVRKSEARRTKKEQFSTQGNLLFFDVGPRLKHSDETDPLPIPIDAPFVNELIDLIEQTPSNSRVFNFSDKTAYNIMQRAGFFYPHHSRLTLITKFFQDGRPITEVKSWTGLTLEALNYYVGKVAILNMGKSLGKQE
jgi:integrase